MHPHYSLQLIQAGRVVQTLDGQTGITRIGRAADNDLRLAEGPDYAVELRPGEGGVDLHVLARPAAVDGTPVEAPCRLQHQQTLSIGDTQIKFTLGTEDTVVLDTNFFQEVEQALAVQPPEEVVDYLGTLLGKAQMVNLEVCLPNGQRSIKVLRQSSMVVGLSPDAGLVVPEAYAFVSRQHFKIQQEKGAHLLTDLGSTNGTYLNGESITPAQPYSLQDRDVIHIGDPELSFGLRFVFHDPRAVAPLPGMRVQQPRFALAPDARVVIGRSPGSGLVLDSPSVSAEHAAITRSAEGVTLAALEGRVTVNGAFCDEARLAPGDHVEIADYLLIFDGEALTLYNSRGYRVDLTGGYKEVRGGGETRRILDDINLSILPHEFVALVGGSGAGKSTLMDGLNGFRPIGGRLIVNNRDFYRHFNEFRPLLGYVPQYDILPRTLTVQTALEFVARLRLPTHVDRAERDRRITEALDTVSMNTDRLRRTRIGALSGGQRKRVSIAAELLADPKLFFLDEPTSGLDPGLEKKMMALLRRLADQGRTVILVTHATSNIVETDHVLFLSEGKMIFFGPPDEARRFFGVQDFADIYERIQGSGEKWRQNFVQADPYRAYVAQRQAQIPAEESSARLMPLPTVKQRLLQYWHQFVVFTQRNLRLTLSDPVSLFVGLIVMPLVGLSAFATTDPGELLGNARVMANPVAAARTMTESYLPATKSHIELFTIAMLSVLVGAFAGSNDLLKERSIYLRERMVNLKIPSYLASKFVVFGGFAAAQTVLYLFVLALHIKMPSQGVLLPGLLEIGISIFLMILAGYSFGLLISAVSVNSDMALYLVLIIVFFQYTSAGAIYNLRGKPGAEAVSYAAAAHWGTIALGTTVDIQAVSQGTILCGQAPDGAVVCQNKPPKPSELFLPYGKTSGDLLRQWGALVLMGTIMTALTYGVLRLYDRIDLRLA